jgi:transcriptional regulator of acetoin/glycerol metabolism
VIERTAILTTGNTILPDDVLLSGTKREQTSDHVSLNEMEKQAIHNALIKFGGNMSRVSKELGLGRTTLYRKLKKYGL